jgi:proteasome-associated ATPase
VEDQKQNQQDGVLLSHDEFEMLKGQTLFLDAELTRLLAQPLVHATVVSSKNEFNKEAFQTGDRVLVIDEKVRKNKNKWYGKISSEGVDDEGFVIIEYFDESRDRLNVGIGQFPQVKLIGKDDGTNVVITMDGNQYEVHGIPGIKFDPTDRVKVNMNSRQIHEKAGSSSAGDVAFVKGIIDEHHIEVEADGKSRIVMFNLGVKIEPSDRVMLDQSSTIVIRILEKDGKDRFNLREQQEFEWDQIAGLDEAKNNLVEALELPYSRPEVYQFYNMKPPKGILLYGPPGCGKTLCAKAAAASLARTHKAENMQSGFIYVKGPELLSKWVGTSEQQIRELFSRARDHHKKYGYPALIFIDEADAILPMRGSGRSSDMENTIVPQFLSEMDGLEESHAIVLLATNQVKRIDPAVCREGRVERHVKIGRPTESNIDQYFKIHMKKIPLAKGVTEKKFIETARKEIFDPEKVLFRITHNKEVHLLKLAHSVTGAMVAGIIDQAKSLAMRRDLAKEGDPEGVNLKDLQVSIMNHYIQHSEMNSSFDLDDFCDTLGFSKESAELEKVPVSK